MTDYGEILRRGREADKLEEEEKRKKAERKAREKERVRVDTEFEQIVLKPKNSCSKNSDLIKFTRHLKAMKKTLKAAEADGFCLDEIMDGLKELGDE